MGSRHDVLARLNAGDPAGAAGIAREILTGNSQNGDVQGLLALALEDAGDKEGALDALRHAVALPAAPSIALRNTTNLAAMLVGAGLKEEAAGLLRTAWPWLPEVEIGGNEHQCITLLADIMKGLDLKEELVAFLRPIVARVPHQWGVVRRTVVALSGVGRYEEALGLIETSARPPSDEPDRQALLTYLYWRTGRRKKADAAADAYAVHAPPYATPRKSEQWFTVGVLNPLPGGATLLAGDRERHFNSNFPVQLVDKLAARYRFASILLGAGPAVVAQFREHRPNVLLNNAVNAEALRDGRTLAAAQALVEATGLPAINAPERAALCTRQMNFERFAGAPDMIVPRLKRFNVLPGRTDEMVRLAEEAFTYPLLVRTVADHDAQNLVLVADRSALRESLTGLKEPQAYLIQYVGATRLKGCHRRLRAAFVEGVPVLMRADYGRHWIVRGRKWAEHRDLYRSHPDLLADADDIVARPEARLGAVAMAALDAIGRTVPLDIFCLDFDVDESGRLVLFEANACANLFSNAPAEIDYPPSADALLLELIERLLHARAEAGATSAKAAAPG
jgi:tetratricopeptide (TPR) repeat protein